METTGKPPTTMELWDLFWKYEKRASSSATAELSIAAATMANAIARIIATRQY